MSQKYSTHVIRGKLSWAKVLGSPVYNEYAKEKQWSVDVSPDAKGLAELKRLKLSHKVKNKKDSRGDFISFRQGEFKKDGSPNTPITITDAQGNPWPADKLIGNDSVGDVKFSYCDFGQTQGSYIKAIRVLKLNEYQRQEFAPLSEDDEFFASDNEEASPEPQTGSETPSMAEEPDLDDDVPF